MSATRLTSNFALSVRIRGGTATLDTVLSRKAQGFHSLIGAAEPVAMMGILSWPATGTMGTYPVDGDGATTASTPASLAACRKRDTACSREFAMSPVVILSLYRAPHLSANPPASLIAFAARFTPSITLLPYAADWPVCPLMLEKCTTFSWANAGAVTETIATTSRGVQCFMARSFFTRGLGRAAPGRSARSAAHRGDRPLPGATRRDRPDSSEGSGEGSGGALLDDVPSPLAAGACATPVQGGSSTVS